MIKTKNNLLLNIKNPNAFFDILLSIPKDTYLEKILLLVKKEQELDYFFLASEAIKNDYPIFKLQLVLNQLVNISILNLDTILTLYKTLTSLHYEFITIVITQKISETSQKFSLELYEAMVKDSEDFMISHITILFLALYKKKNPFKRVEKLLEKENIFLLQAMTETLGFIKLSKKELHEIISIFKKLRKIDNIDLNNTILKTTNKLKDKFSVFKL